MNNTLKTVMTGDIVGHSKLPFKIRKNLISDLENIAFYMPKELAQIIKFGQVQTFRGDSWQISFNNPGKSLLLAVFFRSFFKSFSLEEEIDSRISIGIATVEYEGFHFSMSGEGEAFTMSGKGLDSIHKTKYRMALFLGKEFNVNYQDLFDVIIRFVDKLVTDWTIKQSFTANRLLRGWGSSQIANSWIEEDTISIAAVSQHKTRLGWDYLELALEKFELVIDRILFEMQNQTPI